MSSLDIKSVSGAVAEQVAPDAPLDKKMDVVVNTANHNNAQLHALSPQMGDSVEATDGYNQWGLGLDRSHIKAGSKVIEGYTASQLVKHAEQRLDAKDALDMQGPFQNKNEAEFEREEFKSKSIVLEADKRGGELNIWKSNAMDDETADQKAARILAGQTKTDEEKALVLDREKAYKRLAEMEHNMMVGSDGRPLFVDLTTSQGVNYGGGRVFKVNGETYMGVKMTRGADGQEIEDSTQAPTDFVKLNTNWQELHDEKSKKKAELMGEVEALQKQQNQAVDSQANAFMGQGILPARPELNVNNEEVIELKKAEIEALSGEIERLEGPSGRDEVIKMRANEVLTSDPRFVERLPRGEHFGFKKAWDDSRGDGWMKYNPFTYLTGSKHFMNAAGGLTETMLTEISAVQYLMGASPEEMAKTGEALKNFGAGKAATGYGRLAHEDNFAATALQELPVELAETALDVVFGFFAGGPATIGARTIARKTTKEFIKRSGRAGAEISARVAKKLGDRAANRLEAKIGSKMTAALSAIPGAVEEAGALSERFVETESMRAEADILDAQLQKYGTVEGGEMTLTPQAKVEMEQKRDELRKNASIKEEQFAEAFYATGVASWGAQFVNLDKIIKTDHNGANVADIFMRGIARKKLGKDAAEDVIENEAKAMVKQLTDGRIQEFVKKHGGVTLSETMGDGAVGFATEFLEKVMTTGIANHFFEENADILGEEALTEGGVGGIVSMVTSIITGGMSVGQKRRAMGDLLNKSRQIEQLKGDATDEMLAQLRDNGISGFGQMQLPQEVTRQEADGSWSIQDDADVGTVDNPRGFFAGLKFATQEEAETFAKDRWEMAFDLTMDKALADSVNVVDEQGNLVPNPDAAAKQAEIMGMKSIMRVVANNAAESGQTTTNHFYSAFLRSAQIGGNVMTGNIDRSRLHATEQSGQDMAASILALATSASVADPKLKAVLVTATEEATEYLKRVDSARKARKQIDSVDGAAYMKRRKEIDAEYDSKIPVVAGGRWARDVAKQETVDKMFRETEDNSRKALALANSKDKNQREGVRKHLTKLLGQTGADSLFDPQGKPVADFQDKVKQAYRLKAASDIVQARRLDALQRLESEYKLERSKKMRPTAVGQFSSKVLAANPEAMSLVQEALDKIQSNRLRNKGQTATPSIPNNKQAPAKKPSGSTFKTSVTMEAAIKEAEAKGENFTPEQNEYQRKKAEANAASRPDALNQEAATLFQSDDPVEETEASAEGDGFDYSLARTEEDSEGTQRQVYNYGALERLVAKAIATGQVNGFPTPPGLRNPASLAMVFLRTQAYTELNKKDGKEPDQRDNFRRALQDIYGTIKEPGVAKTGRFQIYKNEKKPIHREVILKNAKIFEQLRENFNSGGEKNGVFVEDKDFNEANLLPLGFFGPVAFTYKVKDDRGVESTNTVYALVSDVFGYDDKKEYFAKQPWNGRPIKTASVHDVNNGEIIKKSSLKADASGKYPNKKVTAYQNPDTGKWVIPGRDGAPPFQRKRGYKMIPVTKAYAEARAMFDSRARRRAFVDAYLNSPIPRSTLSLSDKRTQAKLRTREVIGMTVVQLTEGEREQEIKRLQGEMENAEAILDKELGEGSLKKLKETISGFSATMTKLSEASNAAGEQVKKASDNVQTASKFYQDAARQSADAQTNPNTNEGGDPGMLAVLQQLTQQAKKGLDGAKAKHDEAQKAFASAKAEELMTRAEKTEVLDAIAKLNYFQIRQARIKALESDKDPLLSAPETILETLTTSGTIPLTVRMYATAIARDLKESGQIPPALKLTEKGKGKKKKMVAAETIGEYLNRAAQRAVSGMANQMMRARTADLLKMKVETVGPDTAPSKTPLPSFEDMAIASVAMKIFPNYDPAKHSKNQIIDMILLQPDDVGEGWVTMPSGKLDNDVLVDDLIATGEVGFAAPTKFANGKYDYRTIVASAMAEAIKRGKKFAGPLRVVRLSNGDWVRFKNKEWLVINKPWLYRMRMKDKFGLTLAKGREARAYAAALLDGVMTGTDFATNPDVLEETIAQYQNRAVTVQDPLAVTVAKLVDSLGPNATPSVEALHRSLGRFQRVIDERKKFGRTARPRGLSGPVHRSGVPTPGTENLPFEEQLEGAQKMNDDIDGALGSAEKALSDFMQGGRFLQGTEGPQQTFERGVPVRKVEGTRDTWQGPETVYGEVIGEVMTTFPDAGADEMIDAMLDTLGMTAAATQEEEFSDAGIADDEKQALEDDLDTINEADDAEVEEGAEDSGTLMEFDDSGDEVQDPSIFGENSGMGVGNTDSQDYQRLVEMLKTRSYIPDKVQNLGEFTLEQWMQGEDYDVAKPEASVVESWSKEEEPEKGDGFVMQYSDWHRRRIATENAFSPTLGITNPESPLRKYLQVGDLLVIVKPMKANTPMLKEVQIGEDLAKMVPAWESYEFFGRSQMEAQTFEVMEVGDNFKLGKPKELEKMIRMEAAKFKAPEKSEEEKDAYQENPYPKPSVFDVDVMINRMLGQSVQTTTRLIEAQRIRRQLKEAMLKVRQETDPAKIKGIIDNAGEALEALQGTEPMERMQKLARKLKKLEDTAPPDSAKARERMQKKLVGTFWYRGRVKPAANAMSSIIWHYKPSDKPKTRPSLDKTRDAIFENLGIPLDMTAREVLDNLEGGSEAIAAAKAYIGGIVAWLDQSQEKTVEALGEFRKGRKGGPFGDMVAEFRPEIELANTEISTVSMVNGWQRETDYKWVTEKLHDYHYGLSSADQRLVAGALSDILIQASAIVDNIKGPQKLIDGHRGRIAAIWQSSKNSAATGEQIFNSVGDRIKAAMMPSGWTVPYTSEGVDMSEGRDSGGPDYQGIMERPPYEMPKEGNVEFVETSKRIGMDKISGKADTQQTSTDKKSRGVEVRPWYGIFEATKKITSSKKVSKKEQERRKNNRSEQGAVANTTPSVYGILQSLSVRDTIFGVNPSIHSIPNEMIDGKMEGSIKQILETNRAARKAYYNIKSEIRDALSKDAQVVPQLNPATEVLFNLVLQNWSPMNDNRGDKNTGVNPSGLKVNPEMEGAPDTLFQKNQKSWNGRVSFGDGMPHAIIELNPERATAETFGHEVVHWLNNVRLSNGTSLMEAAMGKQGYADLMAWAEDGDPPSGYLEGSVQRKKAWVRVEERLANGVMAYFSAGEAAFGGADTGIRKFAEIVQRVWRQVRKAWESEAYESIWGTPEGAKAIAALDNVFVHSTGAQQMKVMDSTDFSQEVMVREIMKQFPKISEPEALQMVGMLPDARKRVLLDLNQPIVSATGEGLSQDDPFTALHQFDHTPNVASGPAEPKWLTKKYRESRSGQSRSSLWRMTLKFLSMWTPRGFVNEEILDAKLRARGLRNSLQQEAINITDDLQRAIDEAVTYGDAKPKTLEIYKQLNSYLTASSITDKLLARTNLSKLAGPRMLIAALNARSMIDRLSNELVQGGYVHGNVALTITENLGTYLHRKFPMAKDVDLNARLKNPKMAALLTNIQTQMIAKGFAANPTEAYDIIIKVLGKIDSTSLNPQKFTEMIGQMQGLSSALKNRSVKDEDLAMLLAPLTGMETNPIIRVSDTIRVLTDMMAKTKFQADLRDAGLEAGFIGLPGDKRFTKTFGVTPDGRDGKPALDSNQAAMDNPADANVLGPLQGYTTMPEVAEFYQETMKQEFEFSAPWNFLNTMIKFNGLMKIMATVNNWPTGLKNIYGAFMTYVGSGRSIRGLKTAWDVVLEREFANIGDRRIQRQAKVEKARAMFDEYARLGLIDGSQLGDFMALALNGDKFASTVMGGVIAADSAEGFIGRKFRRGFYKYRRARQRFYLQGDLFFKIAAYHAELEDMRQVYSTDPDPKKPVDDEIKRMAAKRVSQTMFSFDREPDIVRFLKSVPLMGNFISFQAGMLRARVAGFQMVYGDFKEAARIKQSNPIGAAKLKRMAMRRGAGLVAVHALATKAAVSAIASVWGWDEEKLEALRLLAPDFQRGALLIPLGDYEPGGHVQYFNLSTVLPDAWHQRFTGSLVGLTWEMIGRAANGTLTDEFEQRFYDEMKQTVAATAGPFVDATATRKMVGVIFNNEDQYGNRVWAAHDSFGEAAASVSMEVARMFIPGDVKTLARLGITPQDWNVMILDSAPKQMETWKKAASALGWGVNTLNLTEDLQYRFAAESEAVFSSKAEFLGMMSNKNITLRDDVANKTLADHIEATDQAVMRLSRTMEASLTLGTPTPAIIEAISKGNPKQVNQTLNKEMKLAVLRGRFGGQVKISRQAYLNMLEGAAKANDMARMDNIHRWLKSGVIAVESGR